MTHWDPGAEIRDRIMERLGEGAAWTWELGRDLGIMPQVIDEAVAELKAQGLIYRPERTLEDGVITFDQWRLGNPSLVRGWREARAVTAAGTR